MRFKPNGAIPIKEAPTETKSTPAEVLRGLTPEAAERLKGYVDASENFRRRVYGEESETRR